MLLHLVRFKPAKIAHEYFLSYQICGRATRALKIGLRKLTPSKLRIAYQKAFIDKVFMTTSVYYNTIA